MYSRVATHQPKQLHVQRVPLTVSLDVKPLAYAVEKYLSRSKVLHFFPCTNTLISRFVRSRNNLCLNLYIVVRLLLMLSETVCCVNGLHVTMTLGSCRLGAVSSHPTNVEVT